MTEEPLYPTVIHKPMRLDNDNPHDLTAAAEKQTSKHTCRTQAIEHSAPSTLHQPVRKTKAKSAFLSCPQKFTLTLLTSTY